MKTRFAYQTKTKRKIMEHFSISWLAEPSLYINRELSWLEFNQRVLEEALDPSNPLLERVKFLCIVSSNLDEFFEVRVAGLNQQRQSGILPSGPDGMSPTYQLSAVSPRCLKIVGEPYYPWNKSPGPA